MRVSNQKPVELSPIYSPVTTGDFHPEEYLVQTIHQLFNPLNPSQPVTFTAGGNNLTETDVADYFLKCLGITYDAAAQASAKEILHQTAVYFNKNTTLSIDEMFFVQSLVKCKLPEPNASVIYQPGTDVIPAARQFLAGKVDWDWWFASLTGFARPKTLGFSFATEQSFEDFKSWLLTITTPLLAALPADTVQMLQQFQTLKLNGLTESLKLRNDDSENNDENSFARLIIAYLMLYAGQVSQTEFSVMPFVISELYCPQTIVFINVEKHAKATAREIDTEWNIIKQSIQQNIPMISNKQLNKLTATQRALHKAAAMANANMQTMQQVQAQRAARTRFSSKQPTARDLTKIIKKIIKRMATVSHSMNVYKTTKPTYQKPNRRDPDDFNKMGKSTSTKYRPDIHLYIDTSGSISEENYASTMKACIVMAKKLNVNLYFNSFSHILSQTTKLNVKDRSYDAIYKEFQKTDKVTGGTDYEPIWHFVNRSKKRKAELSIIITDFEYYPPNHYVEHPKNLYYIPCANMRWSNIVGAANDFVKNMQHIEPLIRERLMF